MSLDVPSTVALTATLTRFRPVALVQRHAQQARVEVVLPAPGEYRLNLCTKPQADGRAPFDAVLTYRITASKALPTAARPSYALRSARWGRGYTRRWRATGAGRVATFALTVLVQPKWWWTAPQAVDPAGAQWRGVCRCCAHQRRDQGGGPVR